MKKKETKLVFTKEIRAFFRERELRRVETLKAQILKLIEEKDRLTHENASMRIRMNHIKSQFKEFYNNLFS